MSTHVRSSMYLSNEPEIVADELSSEEDNNIQDEEPEAYNAGEHSHVRKRPFWTKDYLLSTCRSAMPNLKHSKKTSRTIQFGQ